MPSLPLSCTRRAITRAVLTMLTLVFGAALIGVTPTQALASEHGWYATVTTGAAYDPATTVVYDDAHSGMTAVSESPDLLSVTVERGESSRHQLIFQAPKGRSLRPGFYDKAMDYPAPEPRPGMEISGCDYSDVDMHFEIREFQRQPNGTVDRLWLLFHEECPSGPRSGEIRIGLDTSIAQVEPSTTRWSPTYPSEPGTTLPVRLRAGTGADLQVSGVSVVGPDADAFTVLEDPCTGADLPAQNWDLGVHACDVRVRFTPTRSGPHTARLRFSTSQGLLHSTLEGMSRPGQTEWSMTSDGEPIGGGVSHQFTPATRPQMGCVSGPRTVRCHAYDQPTQKGYYARLSAGTGDVLVPGSYSDNDSGDYRPWMVVDRSGYSCRQYTGSFDVHQVAYASHDPSELLRFDASFVQYCDDYSEALRGRIRYQASDDTSAPARVSDLAATRSGGSATLTWANPSDPDHAGTVVRYLPGRTAPPRPVTGIGSYTGTGTSATIRGLAADATYTFAVFTYDESGNVSASRVVSVGSPPPQPGTGRWYATVFHDLGTSPPATAVDVFDDSNGVLYATATSNQIDVRVSGGVHGEEFRWSFAAPTGGQLRPGFYDQVTDLTSSDERRPRAYVSSSGGCDVHGHFEVRDIHRLADGTVDRLWLLYELRCGDSGSVFGELHVGLAAAAVRVESAAIRWPDPEGRVLPWVPVWVRATTSDVTVTSVDVTGRHADDFVVRMEDCTGRVIPAGGRCMAFVRAVPMEPGPRTATLTISTTAGTRSVSLDATGPFGDTDWVMTSEPGDYVGGGRQYDYSWDKDRFTVYGSWAQFHARVGGWDADFRPPNGQRLVEGTTYENASGVTHDDGRPHLRVYGNGRSCSLDRLTGWFRVDQARLSASGEPERVDVTFEQRCSASDPPLRGRIRYRAEPDVTPPAPASDVTVERSGDRATVTWTNPTDADHAGTVVRYLPGTTAPPRPDTGIGAYVGTGTSATVTGLDPDTHYVFAVLTYDRAGNFLAPPPLPVATRIGVSVEPDTLTYGQSTMLSARLTDEDGIPLPGERLRLDSRRAGAKAWSPLTTSTTSSPGWVIHYDQPRVNRDYRWVFAGANGLYRATSPTFTVQVRPKVTATLSKADVRRNTTVTLRGRVTPSHAGQRVLLQRYVNGSWTRLKRTTLSADSKYRFTYTPTSAGKKTLRVLKSADADHASGWSPTRMLIVR